MKSRTANSAKNFLIGIIGQFLSVGLNFFTRTVFIYYLSEEYLGLNGLFTNVLSILSISELGIGSAIGYALYKPLAEKDEEKICTLMTLYAKAYRVIGLVIFGLGSMLMPIIPYLAKGAPDFINLRLLYFLYLFDSVTTYMFFSYKSALLKADQKNYIVYCTEYGVAIVKSIVRMAVLIILRNNTTMAFYIYSAVGIGFNIVSNFIVAAISNIMYPYIKKAPSYKLNDNEKNVIKKNIAGAFANKISAAANEIFGNLIISTFIGVVSMGIYSNYLYFINIINTFVRIFANSISASIGNYNATESKENKVKFLKILHFIYTWIYGFCSVCLWVMLNPFIEVWIGEKYLLPISTVMLIVLNFFVYGLLSSISQIQQEAGIFWESKFISLISAVVCVCASLFFTITLDWNISGILIASIISRVCIELPYRSVITCKYVFNRNASLYLNMYIKSTCLTVIFAFIFGLVCHVFAVTWIGIFGRLFICIFFINLIWYVLFRKRMEFLYLMNSIGYLINQLKNRGIKHGK